MQYRPSLFVAAFVALVFTACEKPVARVHQPPLVTIGLPVTRDVAQENIFIGETRPAQTAQVRARVRGFLKTIEFEVGHDVSAGDVLFTIEKDEFQAQVNQARATLAINEAELARSQADYERVKKAAETNAVSASEVGLALAERDKASANIEAARAAIDQAELNLSYTDVISPIDGRVSRNLVDLGNLVGSGDSTLLTTVVELDPLHVYFEISERDFTNYLRKWSGGVIEEEKERSRYPIHVALEGDEGFPHEGWVDFIENTVDSSTGTIQLRAIVDNADLNMYPGLFARIQVLGVVQEGAVLVRESALSADLGGKYLLIVGEENIVERRYVKLGQRDGDLRVITEGMTADQEYIVDGAIRARPGLAATTQTEAEAGNQIGTAAGSSDEEPETDSGDEDSADDGADDHGADNTDKSSN